jgi:peptidoglycan/LPS O-acetylase OafA/YrhL
VKKRSDMKRDRSGIGIALPHGGIDALMIATNGRTSGFDYLRIILAALVILAHSRVTTFGFAAVAPHAGAVEPHTPLFQPVLWSIVPSFFILSGFLVAGSLMRAKTIFEFAMLRVLRLVPALFVQTMIAALILGPLVTDLPLRTYFSAATFWSYPLNIIGDVHHVLPGVFTHNPTPNIVNVQLWTILPEWLCYVMLAIAYLVVVLISRLWDFRLRTGIGLLTMAMLLGLLLSMMQPQGAPKNWLAGANSVSTVTLMLSFLIGATLFFYRDRVPLRFDLFLLSLAGAYIGMHGGKWQYLGVLPLAYATIYVGLATIPKTLITATGDYSYGVYLYGYPVQQTFAYLFPHNQVWELNFIVSLTVSFILAAFSWHFVEFPVHTRRRTIIRASQTALLALRHLGRPTAGSEYPSTMADARDPN